LEWWHLFAHQCSVAGYLIRKVDCSTFQRCGGVFSFFQISPKGSDAVSGNKDVLLSPLALPSTSLSLKPCHRLQLDTKPEVAQKKNRTGRGSNPLSMVRDLLINKENWQDMVSKEQYQFPGVSTHATLNTVLFSSDISQLPKYVELKPHFLWEEIKEN